MQMPIHPKSFLLALALAALIAMQPDMAHAGWGRMFCGWAGVFSSSYVKIGATVLIAFFCFKAFTSSISTDLLLWICIPIVALLSATALLYALSGEDCSVPEDVPQGMSTPVTNGPSQGSATPLEEENTQPAGSQLDLPDSARHGSAIPIPQLEKQMQDNPNNADQQYAPPDDLNIPDSARHGSSVPLDLIPKNNNGQ